MSDEATTPSDAGLGFGPFALLPARRLLLEDGAPVELGARALDILILLASRPGEVVSKQALLREAWPGVFVEEVNLRVHVAAIRRALGDGEDGRRFLSTVPGQGYSFVAPVVPLDPALQVDVSATHWLPRQTRRVVGREDVIASVLEDLAQDRLVTLAGPAGIGKTTVAIAVADQARTAFADRGAFVDLAPVSDPGALGVTLAMALGLTQLRAATPENIALALRGRRLLLVVDNCEHLIEAAAATLGAVLAKTDEIRIIATSREPLGIAGETLRRLPPLEVPAPGAVRTAKQAQANPAIQLFEQRARAARASFELDDASAPVLADICRRLEGVPFAIELAASRVDTFGVSELKAQLDDNISLLDYCGGRIAPRHLRSVRDALAWSCDLLSEPERRLLRRLSVFAGSFSLEDAIDLAGIEGATARAITDGVAALASKSLLAVEFRGLRARYRLLETTRLYAAERLKQDDAPDQWRRRHANLVQARLERSQTPASGAPYLEDLRAALDWAFAEAGEVDTAANLTLAAIPLWVELSLYGECRRWTAAALRQVHDPSEERYRDLALRAALGSAIMFDEGHGAAAITVHKDALQAARRLGDVDHELRALWGLWSCEINTGGYPQSLDYARQFTEAAERSPLTDDALIGRRMMGSSYHYVGEPRLARAHTEAMLNRYVPPPDGRDIRRYHTDQRILAQTLLAPVLWILGLPDQAQALSDRNLREAISHDHPWSLIYAVVQHAFHSTVLAGNLGAAREDLARLSDLAERFPWSAAGLQYATLSGSVEARLGEATLGVPRLEAALRRRAASGLVLQQASALGILAVGQRRMGDTDRALATVEEALTQSETLGELWVHPELLRIKGEILQASGEATAEGFLEAAVTEAKASGALGWELRATVNLAELWIAQNRREAARERLALACARFSEGFRTADVAAAYSLLRRLGGEGCAPSATGIHMP